MAFTTHHVMIRARLQNLAADDPSLLATAASATPVIDAIAINGVDADMRRFESAELSTIEAAIKQFVVDKLDFAVGAPTQVPHGNGTVAVNTVDADAPTETWTIQFLTPTTYTVTGSVSGVKANGNTTVAAGVYDVPDLVNFTVTVGGTPFTVADKFTFVVTAGAPASAGVVSHQAIGNGTVTLNSYNALSAAVETWTIRFLTPTTYSVTGSVSGVKANGNTAVAAGVYDNGIINITVAVGATPFCVGDAWTIDVTF
jgi:hypothetical protein